MVVSPVLVTVEPPRMAESPAVASRAGLAAAWMALLREPPEVVAGSLACAGLGGGSGALVLELVVAVVPVGSVTVAL